MTVVWSSPVRYGECDQQGVVFNAHYMAYCDDASDRWLRDRLGRFLPWLATIGSATAATGPITPGVLDHVRR